MASDTLNKIDQKLGELTEIATKISNLLTEFCELDAYDKQIQIGNVEEIVVSYEDLQEAVMWMYDHMNELDCQQADLMWPWLRSGGVN